MDSDGIILLGIIMKTRMIMWKETNV